MFCAQKRRAFTLIEMLAVMSIVGILVAIITPMVGKAIDNARKMRASRNLHQIAAAYASFALKGKARELNSCHSAAEWAGVMSKHDELNSASLFILSDDYLVEADKRHIPKTIGIGGDGNWEINPEFASFPLSVVVITGVSVRAPASTTPIAYTRGLDNNSGTWRDAVGNDGGIYGKSGGFIAFLDGHVEFYPNLTSEENMLINYKTGRKTPKISEAVNYGARALSWTGAEWEVARK
ncbi:MAG: type II secretion system GspH family protein [Puniceicoccales bacterium]|jgi:prepilin-type N-terminal cleavage/methylation domain-containing protein/prepilin-type processing-associated H-X9-DG protein|nr:type II secretion system GspH family protein [Puniceicoccales bacterium]